MFQQEQQHLLKDRKARIKEALQNLVTKRRLLRQQLQGRELPTVAVMGYTNCMKTSLIQALTGDAATQPWDQLFATLDMTAYTGSLPSRLTVLYVDTIGFPSQLPNELVASFTATLVDVAYRLCRAGTSLMENLGYVLVFPSQSLETITLPDLPCLGF
ncbi:putative GTP-binding protein 6 [Tenrec ecaudatus]|uniref:putative GTP-binding protein 6 n=1 Tax=Tenrec ecaudatus TaxID=94439 RepID=UPI003F59CD61